MLEDILQQAMTSIGSLSGSEGMRGLVGLLLFAIGLFVMTRIPKVLRELRVFWFVEIVLFPAILIAGASVLKLILDEAGVSRESNGPDYVSAVALLLASAYLLDRAISFFVWQGVLRRKAAVVPEIIKTVVTAVIYIGSGYVIIAVVYGQPVTGLVISSGVLLGVLGLALQPVLGDLIAGISLTVDRPFKPGDWIELEGGAMGEVISIDWRATRILTKNNTVHIVPNGRLSNATIHNYDEPDKVYGFWFYVPVACSIPPKLVIQLLLEAAIKSPIVLDNPKPVVRIGDVEELPIRYFIYVHCSDYQRHFGAKSEVLENAWQLFDRAGFTFAARAIEAEFWRGQPAHGSEPKAEEVLDEIKLLSPLTSAERRGLIDAGMIRGFAADEPIVVQDEDGDSAFVILAGMVRVHRRIQEDGGRELELARLGMFEFFGEMSLLTGASRSANVTAYTDCRLLEIPKPCLEPILEKRPELADELADLMAERKLKTELLSSATHQKSMGNVLIEYKEAFARTIRGFFMLEQTGAADQRIGQSTRMSSMKRT